ncbi:cytochrome P450 [Hysterangium stoloniferum]|nr:cytochrome P450 [Hysterangium stoloniferum]
MVGSLIITPLLVPLAFYFFVFRRVRIHGVTQLLGPPPGPWLVGNMSDIDRAENVGDAEFKWIKIYGPTICIKGPFGVRDIMFTADPKALQYILCSSGYRFPKSSDIRFVAEMVTGRGIVWAEGEQHARQRRIMDPAFSHNSIRSFLPIFQERTRMLVAKWRDIVLQDMASSSAIDVHSWLARLTLDIIGGTLDYEFGAINGEVNNELTRAYKTLFSDLLYKPSDTIIAFQDFCGYLPSSIATMIQSFPGRRPEMLRNYFKAAHHVGQMLIDRQVELLAAGHKGGKDIMSLLVNANSRQVVSGKLGNEELLAQLTTILLAGHETIGSTMGWILYELSQNSIIQGKIREEIIHVRAQRAQEGSGVFSAGDFDSMIYLNATIKETLRFHPALPFLTRVARSDDVIPLSYPQQTRNGELLSAIPVSKGQRFRLSLAGYNRLPAVWGEDADQWNPERFIRGIPWTEDINVFSLTFSRGERGCIGWRFAMLELQAILAELVENFRFSSAPGNPEIIRAPMGIMGPMVKGVNPPRVELPLTITPVI